LRRHRAEFRLFPFLGNIVHRGIEGGEQLPCQSASAARLYRRPEREFHVRLRIGFARERCPSDNAAMSKIDWTKQEAPTTAELEALAHTAYQRLPGRFRALTGDLLIHIEDFPTDEVLHSLGIGSPFDLLGLYSGVDLARKSIMDVSTVPDMVFLYRRPILDYWAEHEETLGAILTHVLIHEIGHHFGLSDDDMERIEAEAVG
jgi:predicted Zn-dependent protease with MMP-like domain